MSGSSGNVYAILIGINEYNLAGCHNLYGGLEGVRLLKELLSNAVTITEMIILTWPVDPSLGSSGIPDTNHVVKALEIITQKATSCDSIYIYFSGHGTRERTLWPQLKPDNYDEALVLLPVNGYAQLLRDIEFAWYLKKMADTGASVTVLLDSCFAGGSTRSSNVVGQGNHRPQMKSVSLDPELLLQRDPLVPISAAQDFWHTQAESQTRSPNLLTHWLTQAKGVEFLTACREYEVSWCIYNGKSMVGLFTHCIAEAARRHRNALRQMSCDMIFKAAREEMERLPPSYLAGTTAQNFVFGGAKLRLFLGTSQIPPTDLRVTRTYEPEPGKTHAEFNAGTLHGISKGQGLAIYDQAMTTSNILGFNEPLAVCQVAEVDDWTSRGLLYQADGISLYHNQSLAAGRQPVDRNCKAMQISTILKDILQTPRNAVIGPKDNVPSRAIIAEKIKIELGSNRSLIRLSHFHPFFHITILDQDKAEIIFNLNSQSAAKTVDIKVQVNELQSYLSHIVLYLNIVDFGLAASSKPNPLVIKKLGVIRGRATPPDSHITATHDLEIQNQNLITPFAQEEDPQEVQDRDWLVLRVRNSSTDTLYLEALYIEPSGCVSRISPAENESSVELYPNSSAPLYVQVQKVERIAHNIRGVDFDTILVLATKSEQCHFPEEVLPELEQSKAKLNLDDLVFESKAPTRSAVSSLPLAGRLVKQINIRVV